MNPAVLWVDPEDTVEDVLRQMQQHNVGYVLAGRDAQIEGIISRSDIAAAISPYTRSAFAHWRRPIDDATLQIRIKWFMSRPVHTIRPETSLINVMETMMRHAVRGLPVVDANGRTVGFVTVYDVFAAMLTGAGVTVTGRPLQSPPGVE
jgi:CBS domain-containing protein